MVKQYGGYECYAFPAPEEYLTAHTDTGLYNGQNPSQTDIWYTFPPNWGDGTDPLWLPRPRNHSYSNLDEGIHIAFSMLFSPPI